MDDAEALAKKMGLDAALAGIDPHVGIAFSPGLYDEFQRREWFTLEDFGAVGTSLFVCKLHAYARTHFVFSTRGLLDFDFQVGKKG
jgi:hypothetical protein